MALSWDAPEEDADAVEGYEILRRRPNRDEDTPQTLVANTGSTGTGYTDATATEAGVRYTYRVKAIRDSLATAQNQRGFHNSVTARALNSVEEWGATPTGVSSNAAMWGIPCLARSSTPLERA